MSKARKLQIEVDSTLKKAHEGVEIWEDELEKHLSDPNSKENAKQFDALKRDLKKLQKLRELIRNWLNTGEVKGQDEVLQEARRRIEACMERFKRCEREHKVTRFSKAGLQRDDTDPSVIAKIQCADWLNDVVTQLETQIEQQEADLEALGPAATGKGKGKASSASSAVAEKAKELSFQINRHQEYVSKVERVLRLLENDQVTPEEVEHALKDSLDYFIEAAYEEGAAFIEDEEIWSLLPLDAIEENVGKIAVHKTASENLGGSSREGSTGLGTGSGVGSTTDSGVGRNNIEKEKIKEEEEEGLEATRSVAEVIAGVATRGASANVTPTKYGDASFGDFMTTLPTDGAPATAVTTPTSIGNGGGGGGGGGAVSAATTISGDTGTGTGTGTPSSFTSGPSPSSIEQQQQQQRSAPPGFVHPVSLVMPQQQPQHAQQQYLHVTGPAPGSPFAAPDTPLNQASAEQQQQEQQQQQQGTTSHKYQQQHNSSEEGSVSNSSDLTGGGPNSGFRSPFASKAATAFTPQPSLDVPSSPSSSYFATAATVVAGAGAAGPPGYYHQEGVAMQQQQQQHEEAPTPTPSPAHSSMPPSPLGADWFSFSASWITEADAQHGASAATPWLPTRQDVGLLDSGAMQHRPIIGDADWRRNDDIFSTPAEDFYFSNDGGRDGGGGGGGGLDNGSHYSHHPISATGTRPEWRPRYPTCTPLSYPTEVHPSLKNENLFSKLQLETLFFSFFFHQGSRQQLFAANRLKLQGWRYHKKLSTWFARTMQPEVVTENFEEGVMAYWDPILRAVQLSSSGGTTGIPGGGGGGGRETPVMAVSGWNQGTTAPNFRFEYNLLENENTACPSG
ncbi:hypothetical protein Ndes2526B_g08070 [Nannochloris sp. 'desiccata']|nr:hypothetical protein KSW81_002710 [Chlorella desiccata (nom. nud.)]